MKKGSKLLLAALLLEFLSLAAPAGEPPPPPPLETLLRQDLWQTSAEALEPDMKALGFEWTSGARDSARSVQDGLQFRGRKIYEAIINFRDGKPRQVVLIYFNRGDAGDLRRDQFEKLVADGSGDLNALTGRTAVDRGRDPSSAVKAPGLIWETPAMKFLLEWSATKESRTKMIPFRAEFVRLTVSPPNAGSEDTAPPPTTRKIVSSFAARDHVKRSPNGDTAISGIPMVDQGDRGYCVVASVERVMRYYGAPVDQHELAQIANSDAAEGTSVTAMLASLKRLTARLGVSVRSLYDWDIRDFLKLVEDYNRAAKRNRMSSVGIAGQIIDVDLTLRQMNPEIFKEIRMKKKADFGTFQREIQRSIDEGIPLLWGVNLGMVKEKEIPQAFGGHMRLIIGYNSKTQEILYSDSWGLGHEEKRMAADDAWSITTNLSRLEPLGT